MTFIKQITKKQIIYSVLIVIWMTTVFCLSNEPAVKSSKTSGGITETVVKIITKEPEKLPQKQKDIIETIVRKSAHFTLYTIGSFLIAGMVNTYNVSNKKLIIYAIIFTTIYACTDEIHQIFVDGRSCELRDIIIDGIGASLGTMVFVLMKRRN